MRHDEQHVVEVLDALDEERTYLVETDLDEETLLQSVAVSEEDEVADLVSFFERADRPMFERDD